MFQYTPATASAKLIGTDTDAAPTATVTHIVLRGPSPTDCSCPISRAVVFASLDQPTLDQYTHRYDNCTKQSYEAISDDQKRVDGAIVFTEMPEPAPHMDGPEAAATLSM